MNIYPLKFSFLIFTFLFGFTSLIFSQSKSSSIVKGIVFDAKTNTPLQNVNVSILGTLKGAATDKDGSFIITNVPNSSFRIVVSFVGYKTQKHSIKILKGKIFKRNYFLEEKTFKLPEVTVDDESNAQWGKNLRIFKEQFVGILKNSIFTQILNPYIINFNTTEEGWLSAEAEEAIVIRNDILGYEIKYYLDTFLYQYPTVMYSGQPFFKEINIIDKELNAEIKKTRLETYCGSLRHFLHTAAKQYIQDSILKINNYEIEDSVKPTLLEKHGFKVYTENSLTLDEKIVKPIVYPTETSNYFSTVQNSSQLNFKFPYKLRIVYNREYEDEQFMESDNAKKDKVKRKRQTSWIVLPSDSVLIDTTGYYFDSFNILTSGYWSFDRAANMLPYEYSLPDSILVNYFNEE